MNNDISIIEMPVKKEEYSITKILLKNSAIIFPILFYISGLILGSSIYKIIDNSVIDIIIKASKEGSTQNFLSLFTNSLSVFLIIYGICIVLGLCIIGFQLVNIIPFICGFEISIKISYYYVNYGPKGVGYALLIIIPAIVLFITVLIHAIELSNIISKYIYNVITKKSGIIKEFSLKSYLIRFLIFGILIVIICAIDALLTYLMSELITL